MQAPPQQQQQESSPASAEQPWFAGDFGFLGIFGGGDGDSGGESGDRRGPYCDHRRLPAHVVQGNEHDRFEEQMDKDEENSSILDKVLGVIL